MRKKERLIIIACLLLAVIILVSCWLWLVPKIETLSLAESQKSAERADLEKQIETLRTAQSQIEKGGSGVVGGMPVSLADLKKTIPPAQELEDWYAMIENMAKSAQLTDPVTVTIGNRSEGEVASIPIDVMASGSYESIVNFIKTFQDALRPMNITAIDLTPRENGGMTASIKAIAYVIGSPITPTL
ncbi:MAG: type 4a pilus biogenesis protein PilO [bacterium]|nr:type 4a pilus biogenesis protein PilO [bacterium]